MSPIRLKRKSGQLVAPGDKLGVIEEFMPGHGTYVEENTGIIYSITTGRALIDLLNKRAYVYSKNASRFPTVSSIVIGQVTDGKNKQAVIRIFQIGDRLLSGFFSALLHISNVSHRYVESMQDVAKLGDIIRAKVISEKNRTIHLSTNDRDLGVIYAYCSRCGHLLRPRKQDMRCPECGNIEKRKRAQDYGNGEL